MRFFVRLNRQIRYRLAKPEPKNTFQLYKRILEAIRWQSKGFNHYTWYGYDEKNPVHVTITKRLDSKGIRVDGNSTIKNAISFIWGERYPIDITEYVQRYPKPGAL